MTTLRWTESEYTAHQARQRARHGLETAAEAAQARVMARNVVAPRPDVSASILTVELPMRLPVIANSRMHPIAKWRLGKRQANAVERELRIQLGRQSLPPLPATVTLTKLGPRAVDDDNLVSCWKPIRDRIAKMYGIDDGDARWTWAYRQERARAGSVRVEIVTTEVRPC